MDALRTYSVPLLPDGRDYRVIRLKCNFVSSMPSPIRSWSALYNLLGHPEPDDAELTRAVIITFFAAPHQDPFFASESYYVRILLHSHLSAEPVQHFAEVMNRLRIILPPQAMAGISVDVLQVPARQGE